MVAILIKMCAICAQNAVYKLEGYLKNIIIYFKNRGFS